VTPPAQVPGAFSEEGAERPPDSAAAPAASAAPEDDVQMPFREHLYELRRRLVRALGAVAVAAAACFAFSKEIFDWLMVPVRASLPPGAQRLVFTSAVEPFFVYLKVALYAGLFLGAPAVLYQTWEFIAPGLYRKERRTAGPFVLLGTLFFVGGAAFCYFVVLPPALQFLVAGYTDENTLPMLTLGDQLSLVLTLMLAFGLVFELPLVLTLLAVLGVVDAKFLARYRRHAILGNTIIAAIVTPTGDPFNLALMAVPMVLCYELGIIGARLFGKKSGLAT
jgi:sec-independent protein translocase protein TatC